MDNIVHQKLISHIPRVTKLLLVCLILNLNGLGWQSNNQITAIVSAIHIQDEIEPAMQAAQIDSQTKTASLVNLEGGSATIKLTRVPTMMAQQRREQLTNNLGQMAQLTPQTTEFIQTSADGELATDIHIGNDHVIMPLTNNNNYGYVGEFYLGSVGSSTDESTGSLQKIRILLDTGSANSWIRSKQALTEDSGEALAFDPEESRGGTFEEPDDDHKQNVHITFGSGSLRGYFVQDQCTIGDVNSDDEADRLVLPHYTFGMVTEETCFHNTFDAIVGMAYPEFAEPGVVPFFDSMMADGILKANVFAFFMSMNPDDEDSNVMFGDWDVNKIKEDKIEQWHPVQHKLFWSIQLDDVMIDGKSLNLCNNDTRKCLFTPDTGTSLNTFPSWAMNQFKTDHPDLNSEHSCESELNYGNLTYVINGIEYPIPSHHWMQKEIDSTNTEGNGTCKHTIGTLDVGQDGLDNLFIGGDAFMQLYYTVFDRNLDMVGFGTAVHTAPETLNQWDENGEYQNTLVLCEESFIPKSVCDNYTASTD